jgi:hypothetical protein
MNGKRVFGVLIAGLTVSISSAYAQTAADEAAARAAPEATTQLNPAATAAFASEMQSRVELVNAMLSRFEADAAAIYGADFKLADWRRDFAARLMTRSASELQAAASAPNLAMAQNELFNAATAKRPSAKHAFDTDLKMNLFDSPCRIVDTRAGGGGQLGPAYRLWQAQAAAGTIAAQGGNPAGCGQRVAQGWLMVVTVVPSPSYTSPSFISVQHNNFPTPPSSATMNYVNQNIANLAYSASNDTTVGVTGGFYAYASSLTHVVIDLLGYSTHLEPTAATALDCVLSANVDEVVDTLNRNYSTTSGACPAGYTAVAPYCNASGDYYQLKQSGFFEFATTTTCYGRYEGSTSATVKSQAKCCRIPSLSTP